MVSINWCNLVGMRLVLSMYRFCWGLRGVEERFFSFLVSLLVIFICIFIVDRGIFRYCCIFIMDIVGIGFSNINR